MVIPGLTNILSWFGASASAPSGNPLDDRYYETSIGYPSRAGVVVSAESARKVSAVYRCVSILANILAMFPKSMFEKLDRGRREANDHPLDPIISFRPNRRQTAFEFWRLIAYHLVLRQNAYAHIVPGSPGRGWVGELVPLHPDRVLGPEELPSGLLRYWYLRPNGEKVPMIGGVDIWHLTGLSDDGLKGLSMVDVASDSIGVSLAAERHAARFFERGVKPTGVLQHEKTLKPETAEAMSDSFGRRYGGESGTGKVPVLWEGMKFVPLAMTLKDAEFLDSRKFSVAEIARWFGVPPHMVGDVERSTSWGTGIEQQGLHFLIYSLLPWIELLEQSIRFTLVVQPERFYPKFNVGALLRMDQKTQAEVLTLLIDKGVISPNEARELLDRNPRPGGDEYVDIAAPPPSPAPAPSPPQDGQGDQGATERALGLARALAQARASELIEEEEGALGKLAKKHANNGEEWRDAVTGFYGRFASRVSLAMACPKPAAKGWCETRRGLVLVGGLSTLSAERQAEAADMLARLPLNGGA